MNKSSDLTEEEVWRYARQMALPEIGVRGQRRLKRARVLVVGVGGLGAPLVAYLASAGIGTLGIIDDDNVETSNLHRQILFEIQDLGQAKVDKAYQRLRAINEFVEVKTYRERLTEENADRILAPYDIIADGCDNFTTRYLLNDRCYLLGKPLVSAALFRFDAYLTTFKPYLKGTHPCYRCLFPHPPEEGVAPSCGQAGVLGALAGMIGSQQALEVVKECLGIGESLSGFLLYYESLWARFQKIKIRKAAECQTCGAA